MHNKHKDKMTIGKIINFSTEIIVILKFELIEKLIHKNIKITKAYHRNNLRVNEYNDLTFEDLINDKKFLPEFNAIKEISEEFLKTQYNINNPNFLFYTNKKEINSINDYFYSNKTKEKSIDDKNHIGKSIKEEDDEEKEDKKLNDNLNIDEIKTIRENSFNSIKTSEIDSNESNKLLLNLNENNENKIVNKKKSKSLFFKGEKKDLIKKRKKEKKEKIKNMIIIASFLIKEEKKKEKLFLRKITHQNFENNFEFKKNIPNIKNTKYSASNKNLAIYDNKSNINFLMRDEDDEEEESSQSKNKNNFKMQQNNESQNDSEVVFETKPKTFSNKNIVQNNLLFKSFGDNRNNSNEDDLNEFFLDIKYDEDEKVDEKIDNQSNKNNKKNLNKINQLISDSFNNNENYYDNKGDNDNESNSNNEEDNIDELNNIATNKFVRQNLERRNTYVIEEKKSLFSKLRNRNRNANFYQEIKSMFDNEIFLYEIKNLFNNTCDQKILDKIKMPQSKDIEYLEKEYKYLIDTKRTKIMDDYKIGGRECHIYVFMILLFLFSAMILISLNIDLISFYY